jgi:hypothetical protein
MLVEADHADEACRELLLTTSQRSYRSRGKGNREREILFDNEEVSTRRGSAAGKAVTHSKD